MNNQWGMCRGVSIGAMYISALLSSALPDAEGEGLLSKDESVHSPKYSSASYSNATFELTHQQSRFPMLELLELEIELNLSRARQDGSRRLAGLSPSETRILPVYLSAQKTVVG
jgi:hypothetical protein